MESWGIMLCPLSVEASVCYVSCDAPNISTYCRPHMLYDFRYDVTNMKEELAGPVTKHESQEFPGATILRCSFAMPPCFALIHDNIQRRWRELLPPVTNMWMPALAARSMVADTVVAPSSPLAMTKAKSRLDVLFTLGPLLITQACAPSFFSRMQLSALS